MMTTKTKYVIEGPFGVRRIWEDDEGYFFLWNNIVNRNVIYPYAGEDFKVYPSESVSKHRKRLET